jgi:hypothetical protein
MPIGGAQLIEIYFVASLGWSAVIIPGKAFPEWDHSFLQAYKLLLQQDTRHSTKKPPVAQINSRGVHLWNQTKGGRTEIRHGRN